MMAFENIGLMTPGDMGQAIALTIKSQGHTVCTALEGRSARSHRLSREAGLVDVGTIDRLIPACDVVLSVMDPGSALGFGRSVANALRYCGRTTLFVDCNAIAPATTIEIGRMIEAAGGRYLDGGIIGPPPRGNAKTTIYVSGPGAADLRELDGPHLGIVVVSERIGDASALKMCSGALTKGTQVLWLEVLFAARKLGVDEILERELQGSRGPIYEWVLSQLPIMPPKAYRWVPEMIEISKTFGESGMTPNVFRGISEICEFVAATGLGRESPEEARTRARSGKEVIESLATSAPDPAPRPPPLPYPP
jgi:3-hydroxyisobutyrate dehydrogenase-like beta-hydroxyacid dehydrogenase